MPQQKRKIGARRRQRLIHDLIDAKHDLITLARQYRLSADDLAQWIADPANQQTLAGLCRLADMQTQVLLSRYRLLAAGRLIKLATQDSPAAPRDGTTTRTGSTSMNDAARRACVDLLKLDLKRASFDPADQSPGKIPTSLPKTNSKPSDPNPNSARCSHALLDTLLDDPQFPANLLPSHTTHGTQPHAPKPSHAIAHPAGSTPVPLDEPVMGPDTLKNAPGTAPESIPSRIPSNAHGTVPEKIPDEPAAASAPADPSPPNVAALRDWLYGNLTKS